MTFEEWWEEETNGCERATDTEKYFAKAGWNAALKEPKTEE